MKAIVFDGVTRILGAPKDWDELKQNSFCDNLPIKDENGYMISCWQLDEEERKRIVNGQHLILFIRGIDHPVIALTVTKENSNG